MHLQVVELVATCMCSFSEFSLARLFGPLSKTAWQVGQVALVFPWTSAMCLCSAALMANLLACLSKISSPQSQGQAMK